MQKSKKIRSLVRQNFSRRNFLRMEWLEDRMVLTGIAPIVANDSYQVPLDQTVEISTPGILSNDTAAAEGSLTAALFSGPAHGKLTLDPAGSFQYTPDAGFAGIDSFLYSASDSSGHSLLAAVTLDVGSNTPPVAANDAFTLDEDTSLTISGPGVTTNDSDAEGDPLTASLVSGPLHGSLTLGPDGAFTYTPDADFHGRDGFSYLASDGTAMSKVASVSLEVNSVNDGPIAVNDEYTTDEDTPLSLELAAGVIGNDTDVDGDKLTASLVSGPIHGTLEINSDGSYVYTPNANFNGVDGFSYVVSDGTTESDVAGVTLNVRAVNDAPTATGDAVTTDEDTTLVVDLTGSVLANDGDVDGDSISAELVQGPAHGTVALNSDGTFSYTPEANFHGEDAFVYKANDGTLASNEATVTITVNPVVDPPVVANHRPVAVNDRFTTTVDQPLSVSAPGLLGNDMDADGDPQTAELFAGPQNGTLVLNQDGSFVYSPAAGFQGRDSFLYRTFDGTEHGALAAVTIRVNPAPPAPAEESSVTQENESDAPRGCLLGGAIRSVVHHLELARIGLDGDLLESLAADQHGHWGLQFGSQHSQDRWLL